MFTYRLVSCIFSCITFVLLLVVEFFPGWKMYQENPTLPLFTSLWTVCTSGICNNDIVREMNLDVVRSFLLLASFFSLLAILCSTEWDFWVQCSEDFFIEGPSATIFSFISGLCVLISLVVFDISVNDTLDPEEEHIPDQWAFYLSWFICSLCFMTGIYSLVLYKLSLWRTVTSSSQVVPAQSDKCRVL